jgi:transposase
MSRTHARAPIGERAHGKKPPKSSNVSLIGAVRFDEALTVYPYDGPIDGHKFLHFVDSYLAPTLRDGDVVVMDNLRVHHIEEVEKRLKAVGARPLFLPPYSPERNPIEEIWSLFKRIFRSEEAKTISELINAMKKAVLATTPVKIEAFFAHAAYC